MSEQGRTSIWKNFGPLTILVLAGSFVYALPYFRYYYYKPFLATFSINDIEMANLQTAYGIFALLSYFPGGWLADRVSARKLLTFGMISTGVLGLWLWTIPSYKIVLFIHAAWGVVTILTLWPPIIKAVRMLADADEQGKAFGFFESGRGISNSLHMPAALAIFAFISKTASDMAGLKGVMVSYSIACIIVGIAIFFMLKDNAREISKKVSSKANLIKVLSMPHTWMIIVIIFCSYSMNMSFYYITPYAQDIFGVTPVFAAAVGILANWVRPFASAGAGFWGDTVGCSKVIVLGFVLMFVGVLGLIFLPPSAGATIILIGFSVCTYIAMYGIQAMHYTLLEEGNYSLELSGTAVGVVATLGYLPEVVSSQIAGRLMHAYPGAAGYHYTFMTLAAFAVIGFIVTLIWLSITKTKRAEILAVKREKKAAAVKAA